jgi:DNA-binding transcriptional MerR regulator
MSNVSGGDDSLSIGSFALLTGLSIPQLRRYHQQGILVPADVDPATSYRRYERSQLGVARTIAALRRVDVPVADLATIASGPATSAERLSVLRRQRQRLTDRIADTQHLVELVDQLIEEEQAKMPTPTVQLIEVVLQVDDVEKTTSFYRDAFGFEFSADDHRGALPVHYDACGGTWDPEGFLMFTIFPAGDDGPTKTRFGIFVDDVDATFDKAVKAGGTVITKPWDSGYMPRAARVGDPAGNIVQLYHRASE